MSGSNMLYSGSFDSTAKVWNLNNLKPGSELSSSLTIKGMSFHSIDRNLNK